MELPPSVEYADVKNALDSHELCTADSWVNPITSKNWSGLKEEGHPTLTGQEAYERTVASGLGISLLG